MQMSVLRLSGILLTLSLFVAMFYSTKIVTIGSDEHVTEKVFSPEAFGEKMFPTVKDYVVDKAVDAHELANAIATNRNEAQSKYGVAAGIGYAIPVKLTGDIGDGEAGVYQVKVAGLDSNIYVRVQTGPAILGTELRDVTGTIKFSDFVNQIEYQDAGSAINNEMKKHTLKGVDTKNLTGKKVAMTGVFTLINPKNWLITPVVFEVQ